MRSIKSLSEQIKSDYGIKIEKVFTSDGALAVIRAVGTTSKNIQVCLGIDSEIQGVQYTMDISPETIDKLRYMEFDEINAQTVAKYLDGHKIEFMRNINALQIHTFIPE